MSADADHVKGAAAGWAIAHPFEREAVVLLSAAGWSVAELAMCFETSESTIRRLLKTEGPR